ncbi:MAG: peptidylprolyl isomerase [Flavobacteriales bacterium CG_4_9_14_0_2_um_filter_35_242]|nr:peptidylprolyl isomerase [Flavobacteriales bacterium]OIO10758.1 MAG: peptidylprolyl isomerase [Flavobacteriaceae bacterium CG1_02_35_72]PIV18314.1 MAG: peptidylprolyl isomerase [Flavobacteriales bacterium CG03_land_8_20_14_0_80_35_15]PJC60254.1 MAG: peptidylprolyl isomerase [Flavobacteriales bacterium CG_4_9_14_0_2_um_filter_35_242]
MQLKKTNLKYLSKTKYLLLLLTLLNFNSIVAQQPKQKVDGVAVVIGKNVILDSDIEVYRKELESQSDNKIDISDCEMLEQVMKRKLLAHHAVIDSIEVKDEEINSNVDRKIESFKQQLGSEQKIVDFYGFTNLEDFKKEFFNVEKEAVLISKMQNKITEKVSVTPEEVRSYFKSLEKKGNLPNFGAEIVLEQIVLNVEPSQEAVNEIIKRLKEYKKEVEDGTSFRMKAILYSNDPAVTSADGDIYTINRQSGFVKEFKEAAFSLNEGEISEPFKSEFGYHILQLLKIKGKDRDVRHILLQPEIDEKSLDKAKDSIQKIKDDIILKKITFEDAAFKYSTDKETKNNYGLLINPETSDSKFELTRMDPSLYARVSNLSKGDITAVYYDESRSGEKMYKIILMKDKIPSHVADLVKDYEKIQSLALQKKKQESIDKWVKNKIIDTYIKINGSYKNCNFEFNWNKN